MRADLNSQPYGYGLTLGYDSNADNPDPNPEDSDMELIWTILVLADASGQIVDTRSGRGEID